MRALNHKLRRDLWHMRGQVFAVALVIAGGVATYIMSLTTLEALRSTQESFYREYRFGDVFASLERAPLQVAERIAAIEGVRHVETRVVADAVLEVEGFDMPVMAQIVSVPDGQPVLNRLYLRQGRWVDAHRGNEIIISESFAEAHGFTVGDELGATINGRRRRLVIAAIGLAPDFVFQLSPSSIFPDPETFAILWMARRSSPRPSTCKARSTRSRCPSNPTLASKK